MGTDHPINNATIFYQPQHFNAEQMLQLTGISEGNSHLLHAGAWVVAQAHGLNIGVVACLGEVIFQACSQCSPDSWAALSTWIDGWLTTSSALLDGGYSNPVLGALVDRVPDDRWIQFKGLWRKLAPMCLWVPAETIHVTLEGRPWLVSSRWNPDDEIVELNVGRGWAPWPQLAPSSVSGGFDVLRRTLQLQCG